MSKSAFKDGRGLSRQSNTLAARASSVRSSGIARISLVGLMILASLSGIRAEEPVPQVLSYPMDSLQGRTLRDAGPLKIDAEARPGVEVSPDGKTGACLRFTGTGFVETAGGGQTKDLIGSPITIAMWIKPEAAPPAGAASILLTKRNVYWKGCPFNIMFDANRLLCVYASNGGPQIGGVIREIPLKEWTHLAITHEADKDLTVYLNGQEARRFPLSGTLASNDEPLLIGHEQGSDGGFSQRAPFQGWIDELQIYAAALDPAQIREVMEGNPPPVRAALAADLAPPQMQFTLQLARSDIPLGFRDRDGGNVTLTRAPARRVDGPNAVDWPSIFVGDKELFKNGSQETFVGARKLNQSFGPLFQQPDDNVITPGNHWFRGVAWKWGQTFTYTTDPSMRGTAYELELWTFPIRISADQPGALRSVKLTWNGRTIYDYQKPGPLDSLVLLLPQNRPGPPYELSVNGSKPVPFDAGLEPVTLGDPREMPVAVNLTFPDAPGVRAENLRVPEYNPNRLAWKKQLVDMRKAAPPEKGAPPAAADGFARHLGLEAPRAPILNYTVSMVHGMSGGHYFDSMHAPDFKFNQGHLFPGSEEDYAKFLRDEGIDMVFEKYFTGDQNPAIGERSAEKFLEACGRYGIRAGFNIVTLSNPNLAFYSRALPDFWLPKLRDIQLIAQRMRDYPALAGFVMGADNGAYVPFWDWAPPASNRPWGEAFLAVHGADKPPRHPIGPGCKVIPQKQHEYPATQREFLDYVADYDKTFEQYGEFYARLAEVDPRLVLTTMSFGSSPGIIGDGGWPIGTVPGFPMFKNLPVLQTYDWDETDAERPVHNLALADRLRSYFPGRPLWMLLDNFYLKFNREALQRVTALALTRGPAAVGHNWLPQPRGPDALPRKCADLREVNAWVHRYSGAYADTRPLAPIGILYVHKQAVSRNVLPSDANLDSPAFLEGSHEGKTTEALFLCHAAGWPARIITPEELRRGLPPEMKTILLTGLNQFDGTWLWSNGLEKELAGFAAAGGRLVADDESVVPDGLSAVRTGMRIHAYTKQGDGGPLKPSSDPLPRLMKRNRENIAKLREAMASAAAPSPARSDDPALWAVPHRTGDVDYLTVTNWSYEPDKPAVRHFKPHAGKLAWDTSRPVYDVTQSRKLSANEAAICELTKDAVRLYACPPGEVGPPEIAIAKGKDGFYEARIAVPAGAEACAGIPLEINLSRGGQSATLHAATGHAVKIPVSVTDPAGSYTVTVTELLSGQSASVAFEAEGDGPAFTAGARKAGIRRFFERKDIPLAIALTPEQEADEKYRAVAQKLADRLRQAGRPATVAALSPEQLVTGLQPYAAVQKHPQWQTLPTDLVLLGNSRSNILIHEQELGSLFPSGGDEPCITYSPFHGGYHCLNLFGDSPEEIDEAAAGAFSP